MVYLPGPYEFLVIGVVLAVMTLGPVVAGAVLAFVRRRRRKREREQPPR